MIKVTMNLTQRDAENAEVIYKAIDARSKAQAVSTALALARSIIEILRSKPGAQIVVRHPDNSTERLFMPELEQGARQGVTAEAR